MEYTFFSYLLENDNALIQITPNEFFNVDYGIRYVIIYKLSVIDKKNPVFNRESLIPYYISNGQTNKLRANMIYPFMCYSDWDNQGICPYFSNDETKLANKDKISLLLKYQLYPNYKYVLLEEQVLENFISMKGIENKAHQKKIILDLQKKSRDLSRGIMSVLPRLRNFLDFVLCIINENIINFGHDAIDIRCFRPLVDKDTPEYINMGNCNMTPEELNYEDDYRYVLLTLLSRYSNTILKYNIIDNIEHISMKARPITIKDFDIYVSACNKNSIIKNTSSFGIVSKYFKDVFMSKLGIIIKSIDKSKELKIEESDILAIYNMLSGYANPFKPIDYYEVYNDHLRQYGMDCSKFSEDEELDILERSDL